MNAVPGRRQRRPSGGRPGLPDCLRNGMGARMEFIDTIEALTAHYGTPGEPARVKVTPGLTPAYRAFVERSRFCILSTVGPDGTDASPRGDDGPVVTILDPRTLALPDWRGNERIDSLRNIVADGRVSLMFFVQGSNTVIRVNGRARLTADAALRARFERDGRQPRTVAVIAVAEVYSQCARALVRAGLWSGEDRAQGLPTVGDMLRDATDGRIDGAAYDAAWPARAAGSMW
jgi:PPOX class probable FMN-dependent enzyme